MNTGRREVASVCVAGGGPAGAALAIRLAQLGHRAVLVDRGRPRSDHLGESLSAGVLMQLDLLGAHAAAERAGFAELRSLQMRWQSEIAPPREFGDRAGLLVERGRFDAILREIARAHGVRVLQPAMVREYFYDGERCHVRIEAERGGAIRLDAAVLALAGGRAGSSSRGRRATGPRTLAISAVCQGAAPTAEPGIEAGAEEWYWGMPLPGGRYSITAFVDPRRFRDPCEPVPAAFARLIARSRLFAAYGAAGHFEQVRAADATPYLDTLPAERHTIRVGEAALALDPLSSSGVQRALQGALAAAIVVNTLLRRPSDTEAALTFYRHQLTAASDRHRGWTAALYRAAAGRDARFWQARAAGADGAPEVEPEPAGRPLPRPDLPVALAAAARFAATACIVGDFIAMRPALHHPRLDEPVAFIGDHDLAPLLAPVTSGLPMTAGELVASWSGRIALRPALAILGWLLQRGVLVSPTYPHAGAFRNPTERGMSWLRPA